jgi:hypothetical protein
MRTLETTSPPPEAPPNPLATPLILGEESAAAARAHLDSLLRRYRRMQAAGRAGDWTYDMAHHMALEVAVKRHREAIAAWESRAVEDA